MLRSRRTGLLTGSRSASVAGRIPLIDATLALSGSWQHRGIVPCNKLFAITSLVDNIYALSRDPDTAVRIPPSKPSTAAQLSTLNLDKVSDAAWAQENASYCRLRCLIGGLRRWWDGVRRGKRPNPPLMKSQIFGERDGEHCAGVSP